VSDPANNALTKESRKRSNSWHHAPNNDEIVRAVRARLTFREVPVNHLPTPATITLRRASGLPADFSGGSPAKAEMGISVSLLSRPGQWNESRPPVATYLITTEDIDFITNLIQSGFDIKKAAVNKPSDYNRTLRKPSITSQGVLPLPSVPAHLTTTVTDVHQAQHAPRIALKDLKSLDSKPTMGGIRKLSRALALKIVPEVIWENTRSPGSASSSSKASSPSEEQDKIIDDSSDA
jgi:hypothetical protein